MLDFSEIGFQEKRNYWTNTKKNHHLYIDFSSAEPGPHLSEVSRKIQNHKYLFMGQK
tara:strand:- start:358 stop:528 length:171 start_codon:yes stop_codon:yes gene_type:complete